MKSFKYFNSIQQREEINKILQTNEDKTKWSTRKRYFHMILVTLVSFALQLSRSFSTNNFFLRGMVISNYTENESVEILYFLICCLCIPFISICVQFICGTISDYCQLPIGKGHFFISLGKLFWIIGRCIAIGCSIYPVILIWKSNEDVKRNESRVANARR